MMYSLTNLAESPEVVLEPLVELSGRNGAVSLAERLKEIKLWLADDLAALERDIRGCSLDSGDLAEKAASHLLKQPGKRIRPLCVVLAARVGSMPMTKDIKSLAVACEVVHAATLLHDDVLDEGTERRGADASRILYGNSASILGGDYLLIEALKKVQSTGDGELLSGLMDVISAMVQAEAIQLERRGDFVPDREQYLEIISGKTASIFEWGLRAGASFGGIASDYVGALAKFGFNLGIAFQMADDVLDLAGDPSLTGKNTFADIRDGKLTWPLILACEADPKLEEQLREIALKPEKLTPRIMTGLRERILKTDCLEETRRQAQGYQTIAEEALKILPSSRAADALKAVVAIAVTRGM